MKLAKAIELLTELRHLDHAGWRPDDIPALNLGIEALKHCQRLRSDKHYSPIKQLPGETLDREGD